MSAPPEPILQELPFPTGPDELRHCRQQVLDYIAYVARNWPPDRAEAEIALANTWLADATKVEESLGDTPA